MPRFFTPKAFRFLKDLAENNDRDWFKANQNRYEHDVRQPALDFIGEFSEPLYAISPHFTADPRKVGGSLFRIQRDIRFSKDKTPYKTHVGIQFRHIASQDDVHAPGFYLHLEPGACYAGVGLWRPSTADAYAVRDAIADDPKAWRNAAHSRSFTAAFEMSDGNKLQRPPKGFDADHPLIEDLKRRDFTAGTPLAQRTVTSSSFIDDYTELCRTASPFMEFLCKAVGVAF